MLKILKTMTIKIKICGIQTLEAAQAATDAGADFLGFNFIESSSHFIEPKKAKEIIDKITKQVKKVGVFQNEKLERVETISRLLNLDFMQLHGTESPDYAAQINFAKVIKTFSLTANFNVLKTIEKMKDYKVDYFLLDRKVQGRGKPLNLRKVKKLISLFPIFLAGRLTPENVSRILSIAKPYAVDVAGGVETDGVKDRRKIIKFIKNAKKYE